MTASLLKVSGLTVDYGAARALTDINFELGANRSLAILGPNGAGKSTLARAISGLIKASAGSIEFDGNEIAGAPAHKVRTAGLIHLPEGRGVFRTLSVLDNLKMGIALDKAKKNEGLERAFELFPVLGERRKQSAGTLSGGEQQMLSLARALMVEPRAVIADEMSLGLAPKMVDLVFESLQRARDMGVSVIMTEQFGARAIAFADDALILQRGGVAWTGPTEQAGDELMRRYLGDGSAA